MAKMLRVHAPHSKLKLLNACLALLARPDLAGKSYFLVEDRCGELPGIAWTTKQSCLVTPQSLCQFCMQISSRTNDRQFVVVPPGGCRSTQCAPDKQDLHLHASYMINICSKS